MKKLIAIIFGTVMLFSLPAKAEIAIGLTANFASVDTDGSETELSGDKEVTNASVSEDHVLPELFIEALSDNGFAVGIAYIPVRELGAKKRTDTSPTGDTETEDAGDYKASAELDNVVQVYTNIPLGPVYVMLGVQHAELLTTESLDEQNDYEDASLFGYSVGLGYRGSIGDAFYKVEGQYTDFNEYKDISSSNEHEVVADTEVYAVKLSLGMAF